MARRAAREQNGNAIHAEYKSYSTTTGRYTFEEIDVIAMDFGDDFAEELSAKLDEVMKELIA